MSLVLLSYIPRWCVMESGLRYQSWLHFDGCHKRVRLERQYVSYTCHTRLLAYMVDGRILSSILLQCPF